MTTIADNGLRYIDSDGHILEHPTAMPDYAPAKYRDRIWHLETDAEDRIDARLWKAHRDACRVVRQRPDEQERLGHLVHRQGGGWAFHYDGETAPPDDVGYHFADDESLVLEMISGFVGVFAFTVIMERPAAARPVNEMAEPVRFVRALPGHAAGFAIGLPQPGVDAILGVERRHQDVGYFGVAVGMAGFARKRDADLPELCR